MHLKGPREKMMATLIGRIEAALPCFSGHPLTVVEADSSLHAVVDSLVHQSQNDGDFILWGLCELLGRLDQLQYADEIQVLQSQLFLLKIVSLVLANRSQPTGSERPASIPDTPSAPAASPTYTNGSQSPQHKIPRKSPSYASDTASSVHSHSLMEATPIVEEIAKYCLSVITGFLRHSPSMNERRATAGSTNAAFTLHDFESTETAALTPFAVLASARGGYITSTNTKPAQPTSTQDSIPSTPLTALHNTSSTSLGSSLALSSATSIAHLATSETLAASKPSLMKFNAKFAANIIFHLSASNWTVVFERVRKRIHSLSNPSADRDSGDLTDLRLITHCVIDRHRLCQFIAEVSSLLLNLSKDGVLHAAAAVRKSIWVWIETFPLEYADVLRHGKRMDGVPERMYDALYAHVSERQKWILWPALTALLAISPERLKQAEAATMSGMTAKKGKKPSMFLDTLSSALSKSDRTSEIALLCYLDLSRAASHIPASFDNVAIRGLEIHEDIKNRLLHPTSGRPFYQDTESLDVCLYSDALATLYRHDYDDAVTNVFRACLRPETSEAVKMTVVRACLSLCRHESQPGFEVNLAPLYQIVAPRLRDIFAAAVAHRPETDEKGRVRHASIEPLMKREESETASEHVLLVLAILSLFRTDIGFLLHAMGDEVELAKWTADAVKVIRKDANPHYRLSGTRTFANLFQRTSFVSHGIDYACDIFRWHYVAAAPVMRDLALLSIDSADDNEEQRLVSGLMLCNLQYWASTEDTEASKFFKYGKDRLPSLIMGEISLLLLITSSQAGVVTAALQGLKAIANAEGHLESPAPKHFSSEDQAKRWPVYEQLGEEKTVLGRALQQKRIRKLLRHIAFPCTTHQVVWEESYRRFVKIDRGLREGTYSGPAQDLKDQRSNLLLFMMALSGCCTNELLKPLTELVPMENVPIKMRDLGDTMALADKLIDWCIDQFMDTTAETHQIAKDALGTELHYKFFQLLFNKVDKWLGGLIAPGVRSDFSQEYRICIEAIMTIQQQLLDRDDPDAHAILAGMVDEQIRTLARVLDRAGSDPEGIALRLRFCTLCNSVMAKREHRSLRNDYRNEIFQFVISWVAAGMQNLTNSPEPVRSCLVTTVSLSQRLILASPGTVDESDLANALSRAYQASYKTLLDVLSWAERYDKTHEPDPKTGPLYPHVQECVISTIANLCHANADVALKYCANLAYDENERRRLVFCRYMSRVLDQGTSLGISTPISISTFHNPLCELIKDADVNLITTMCETCPSAGESDRALISVLLNLFDTPKSLVNLMKVVVEREVARTGDPNHLFRGNNMYTLLLSGFTRLHGYDYLREVLLPTIKTMTGLPAGMSYEIDPRQLKTGEDISQNLRNVLLVSKALVDVITESHIRLPPMIREVSAHIAEVVGRKWPDRKYTAVGSFLFLRFMNPAITQPATIDIDIGPNEALMRRGLITVSKVLNSLVNNVRFGKEPYMEPLNEFLDARIKAFTHFLSTVCHSPVQSTFAEDNLWLGVAYDESDVVVLQRFFSEHSDKIGKELLSLIKTGVIDEPPPEGKSTWDKLCATLVELGPVAAKPRLEVHPYAQHTVLQEFVQRYAHCNTAPMAQYFTPIHMSWAPADAYLLPLHLVNVETTDYEMLTYYILSTLSESTRPFDIILDCSGFTVASELPMQWLKTIMTLISTEIASRYGRTYIVSSNILAQRYLRKAYNICGGIEVKAIGVPVLSDVIRHRPDLDFSALSRASMTDEPSKEFAPVTLRQKVGSTIAVILHVAETHIRMTTVRITLNAAIRSAKSRFKDNHSSDSIARPSRLSDYSSAILNAGLWNVCHTNQEVRSAAYNLLHSLCSTLNYDGSPLMLARGTYLPQNPMAFAVLLSDRLSVHAPRLTLDFLDDFCNSLAGAATSHKLSCLQYISPWIRNLPDFCEPGKPTYDTSVSRFREVFRNLIDFTVREHDKDPSVLPSIQQHIWDVIGKLDPSAISNVILEETCRAAIDGGVDSPRCNILAEVVVGYPAMPTRAKLLVKLRKALKPYSPSSTSPDANVWSDAGALMRLCHMASYNFREPGLSQIHVPEVLHVATLFAGMGPLRLRTATYGLVISVVQSLLHARKEDVSAAQRISNLLEECTSPAGLELFGLKQDSSMGAYEILEPVDAIESLEKISDLLLRVLKACASSTALSNVWVARWVSLTTASALLTGHFFPARAFVVLGVLATSDLDADLFYQLLMAFKRTIDNVSDSGSTIPALSMLNSIRKLLRWIPSQGYIKCVFWLGAVLLSSPAESLYMEGVRILSSVMDKIHSMPEFRAENLHVALGRARREAILVNVKRRRRNNFFEERSGLSIDQHFSFSLATFLLKGIEDRPDLDACDTLRALIRTTLRCVPRETNHLDPCHAPIHPDVVPYFLILLLKSADRKKYRRLLELVECGSGWIAELDAQHPVSDVIRVNIRMLGDLDATSALLIGSLLVAIFRRNNLNDAQKPIMFWLLADLSNLYPEIIVTCYESVQDKLQEAFATSSNPEVLGALAVIVRVAMADRRALTNSNTSRSSHSSLSTVSETMAHGRSHVQALKELKMEGMVLVNLNFVKDTEAVNRAFRQAAELIDVILQP
ncbi:hypothetical protein SISNIDRAFT_487571 [Sistotremastrum niveocremeum HHB9708]|uniref:Ras-GAP domain-containing protein n=1 Tax=Sistotremastrum niveocremeum HHB9708 TaxID=1314777 RepID=A0A164S8I4_9AGAM|nr:hypothetical protein SISNIDRAFT_487571 [Sistotremastrum niveocremeum HHB9708]